MIRNEKFREISKDREENEVFGIAKFLMKFSSQEFFFCDFFGQCVGKIKQVLLAYAGKSY